VVPVATQVWSAEGDDHHVSDPDADVLVAARTDVALARLVGLDPPDLDV